MIREGSGALGFELHHEVEQFLYEEAALLDGRRYRDWLGCFTHDVQYVVRARENRRREEGRPAAEAQTPALFEDDAQGLRARVGRISSQAAWSEIPAPRTLRIVGNVRVRAVEEEGRLEVLSNLLLHRNRRERDQELFACSRTDVLRRTGERGLLIARRSVVLEQTTVLADNLSLFF